MLSSIGDDIPTSPKGGMTFVAAALTLVRPLTTTLVELVLRLMLHRIDENQARTSSRRRPGRDSAGKILCSGASR